MPSNKIVKNQIPSLVRVACNNMGRPDICLVHPGLPGDRAGHGSLGSDTKYQYLPRYSNKIMKFFSFLKASYLAGHVEICPKNTVTLIRLLQLYQPDMK